MAPRCGWPDSGSGSYGPFKGRVAAIGGTLGYAFKIDELPITATVKYYHEFAAKNRIEGDAGFLTFAMPIRL